MCSDVFLSKHNVQGYTNPQVELDQLMSLFNVANYVA